MSVNIESIVQEAKEAFANCQNQNELLQQKANFLGKKGPISAIMATMRDLSIEEKKTLGAQVNVAKVEI
jgi:phenylalanyl-tRNA synthetase alpha chain